MEMVKRLENDEIEDTFTVSALNSPLSEISSDTVLPNLSSRQGRTSGPTRRSTKGRWTEQEDDLLAKAVKVFQGKSWRKVAERFPGRSDVQCLHRWQKVLNPNLVKGPWTKEEDDRIIELVNKFGSQKWSFIAKSLPGRIGKQCRERWHNHLNPGITKNPWTKEEEVTLIRAHQHYGNKWAEISKFLPGRADNSIKNHWNCSVKKKLGSYQLGIDDYNFYNDDHKEETIKVKETHSNLEKLSSRNQGTNSDNYVDTSLGVSILGVSNRKQKNLFSHSNSVKVENRCLSEDLSLSLSTFCQPLEVTRCRNYCQSPPAINMGVTESPKRPRHCSSPLNECNNFFLSHRRSNFSTASPQSKDVSLYSSPVCCSTPTSSCLNGSSPEAILRTAAKNFKNTPSIIRKRTRETCKQYFSGDESNSTTCTSDMRSRSSNDSTYSCEPDDSSLNVKWLSLSSPGLHVETQTPMKSVEKRLEYAFDLEWNSSQLKSSGSATETDCSMLLGIGVNCKTL